MSMHLLFAIGVPFGLVLSTVAVYFNSLMYGFIFDDLKTILTDVNALNDTVAGGFFSYVRWVPRALNQVTHALWGVHPFPYRLINLGMHIIAGLLMFALLLRLFDSATRSTFLHRHARFVATLASMLFLLHPVQTQTVTYVTQMRLEGMVTLWMFAVLVSFAYSATTQKVWLKIVGYTTSLLLAACASGTKEIVIVLPLLVVLIDWFFIAQAEWSAIRSRMIMYFLYVGIVWGLLLYYGLLKPDLVKVLVTHPLQCNSGNILTSHPQELINCISFALSQFKVLLHYIGIFFFPVNLSFDYDVKLARHVLDTDVWVPALVLSGLLMLLIYWYRSWKTRILTFSGLWFFIVMLPRTSIVPSTELICDYKTFPASLGMMVMLAYCIVFFIARLVPAWPMISALVNVRGAIVFVQCASCVALIWMSNLRTTVWSSEMLFWHDSVQKSPKARVLNNYATSLLAQGDVDGAIGYFNKAIERDSLYAEPHAQLATIYHAYNDVEKALRHYARAVELGRRA